MPYGVLKPHAFLAVSSALPLNPSSTPDEIIASGSEPAEDQMPVSLCGDTISSRLLKNGWKSVNPRGYRGGQEWLW